MKIHVERLSDDIPVPFYATDGAAGMDLHAVVDGVTMIYPFDRLLVNTGIRVAIPPGFEGQIRSRSGLALLSGIMVLNSPGTIDSDYRGEIKVLLINLDPNIPFIFQRGERIAQLVIAPVVRAEVVETKNLDETTRGDGGFGSTGR
jgi:dUTP pyrophosphatase